MLTYRSQIWRVESSFNYLSLNTQQQCSVTALMDIAILVTGKKHLFMRLIRSTCVFMNIWHNVWGPLVSRALVLSTCTCPGQCSSVCSDGGPHMCLSVNSPDHHECVHVWITLTGPPSSRASTLAVLLQALQALCTIFNILLAKKKTISWYLHILFIYQWYAC